MRSKVLAATLRSCRFCFTCVCYSCNAQSASAVAAGISGFTSQRSPDRPRGLKVVEQYDFTRTYRPLTMYWASRIRRARAAAADADLVSRAESSGKAMTVGDYSDLLAKRRALGD